MNPKRILRALSSVKKAFRLDRHTERFVRHNRRVWRENNRRALSKEIIVELWSVSESIIAFSYVANTLADAHDARILTYGGKPSLGVWLHNISLRRIYRSFGAEGHVVPKLTRDQTEEVAQEFQIALSKVTTKQDLVDLKVFDLEIGVDVYESYLRVGKATLDLNDPDFANMLHLGVSYAVYWRDYFNSHDVAAVVVSHFSYVSCNVLAKVAYAANVPAYTPIVVDLYMARAPFSNAKQFWKYPAYFDLLSDAEKIQARALAETQLEKRFSGEIGVNMTYSVGTAFGKLSDDARVLSASDNIKVLIATHCFYDNPHTYGGMLFPDFFEWLEFLGKMTEKTPYDWYIKTHPVPLLGTEVVVSDIIRRYPKLKHLPATTTHNQIIRDGVDFVITGYGTVGSEYASQGVQVINSGDNPHQAYDFNWHPKSLEEFASMLLNLENMNPNVDKSKVYEFYFSHHYMTKVDDLFFPSYAQMAKDVLPKDRIETPVLSYFLDAISDEVHEATKARVAGFVESELPRYYEYQMAQGIRPDLSLS